MEQMTAQLPQTGQGAGANRAQRLQRGMNAGVSMDADAFMLIFQNMAAAVNAETEELMNGIQMPGEESGDPFAQLFDQLAQGEDEGEISEELLTQMQALAGILMLQPEQLSQLEAPQVEALLQAAGQEAGAVGQMEAVQSAQSVQTAQIPENPIAAVPVSVPGEAAAQVAQPENQVLLSQAAPVQPEVQKPQQRTDVSAQALSVDGEAKAEAAVERPVQPVGEQKSLYEGENQFRSAVAEARKQLAPKKGSESKEMPEAFQLSGAAVKEPLTGTVMPKSERLSGPVQEGVSEQISNGAKEQFNLGKTEFVLKLKPESLGEVTVKLTEKDGKTTLTILTASPQAAKAINDDLAALRETMKPMAVEVREAVQQTAENSQAQMQQFSMSGQQFNQQQRAFQSGSGGTGGFQAEPEAEEELSQVLETSGLDTYV